LSSICKNSGIEKAKVLLRRDKTLPVQVIGHQVGFENPQHFMKVFKRLVGRTPGAYREADAEAGTIETAGDEV